MVLIQQTFHKINLLITNKKMKVKSLFFIEQLVEMLISEIIVALLTIFKKEVIEVE
jgi:hypothetical protein